MAQTAGVGGRSHDFRPTTVAVVGTGLAGLTTAYLLRSDKGNRFRVTLFEQVVPTSPGHRRRGMRAS